MSHQEKAKLKEEIANSVPKDVRELLGDEIVTNEDDLCDQVLLGGRTEGWCSELVHYCCF